MRTLKFNACFISIAIFILAAGSSLSAATDSGSSVNSVSRDETAIPGPLDGMTFTGALGPDGKPKDTPDTFVFESGTFVSKECELRCKYPARPYFIRTNGNKTEFISETKCPYKDAKIIWRGSVEGDTISGKSTWIVKRWYWTIENTFEFEGKLVKQTFSKASAE